LLLLSLCSFIPAASAQTSDNAQASERMDRLEHDIMLMQRQVANGGSGGGSPATAPAGNAAGQLEVRLSNIEQDMRNLRGKVEENEFQVRKLADTVEKFQKDTDFRFNELAQKAAPAAPATPAAKPEKPEADAPAADRHPIPGNPSENDANAGDDDAKSPLGEPIKTSFATPRDHYNYAFRLLNQTQYDEASKAFDAFTKKYPKDPLIGNAYYWQGETYYIRHDFVHAADDFRQGFEALPEGPKAADNLLKLAMSLDALNRDKEACVVLQQIGVKFKKGSTNVVDKASQEQKRIGCQ
jgi:tol-pal system protein YbgF